MKKFKMKKSVKKLWTDALRDEEYKQTKYAYARKKFIADNALNGIESCSFCALGVLADAYNRKVRRKGSIKMYSTEQIRSIVNTVIPDKVVQGKIVEFNDTKGWSFNKIAGYVDRYL